MVSADVVATVCQPDVLEREAVGSTGDTITGILAALVHAGTPQTRQLCRRHMPAAGRGSSLPEVLDTQRKKGYRGPEQ